ncbi:hypothetical protein BDR22DRAFT_893166 [Usnea florida]
MDRSYTHDQIPTHTLQTATGDRGIRRAGSASLQTVFPSKLETMMQLAHDLVEVKVSLLDLGCDSLLAVEIGTWLLKEVHVDIPVLKILSGETVDEIRNEAARKYFTSTPGKSQDTSTSVSVPENAPDKNSDRASGELPYSVQVDENTSPLNTSFPPSPSILAVARLSPSSDLDLHAQYITKLKRVGKMSYARSRI